MSEQTIKEVRAKFTADLSDYRKQVENAGKISQDLQDRISAIGDAMTAAQNVTGAEMQKISRSLSSAGKQAATLGRQAQSLAADESQLTRAIAEQEGSLNRMEAEYNSLQTETQRLSGIFDTVQEAVSGLNLSGTLSEEAEKSGAALLKYTKQIEELENAIAAAEVSGKNRVQLSKFGSLASLDGQTVDRAKQKLQELTTAADQAAARVDELAAAEHKVGQANLGYASTAGLKQLQTEIGNNKSKMEQLSLQAGQTASRLLTYQERLDQTKSKQQQTAAATQTLTNEVSEMESAAASATAPASLSERLGDLASRARDAAEGGLSKLGSALLTIGKSVGGGVLSGLKSLANRITGIGSSAKSTADNGLTSMVRQIRNIGVVSLGLKVCSSLFGQLRSVISNCVSSNESLSNQVEVLQNSLSSALAPAISLVVNLLSKVMPYLVGIADAIASILTNLFGTGWTTVSTGLGSTASDAADAVGDVTDATNDAADAQEAYNKQILGFDEITKLEDTSSSGSSGSGGSSGSSGSGSSSAGALAGVLPEWLSNIMSLIEGGQWAALGTYMAECVGSAVDKIYDVLTSPDTYAKIDSAVSALSTTVNSFFRRMNLVDDATGESIASKTGRTIGAALNLATYTVNEAVQAIDWSEIGLTMANTLNGFVAEANWGQLGQTIGNVLTTLPTVLYSFVVNTDWGALASGIFTAIITAIDTVTEWIRNTDFGAVLDAILNGLSGMDWEGLATSLGTLLNETMNAIDWDKVGRILASLLGGAVNALATLASTFDWATLATNLATLLNRTMQDIDWNKVGQTISDLLVDALTFVSTFLSEFDWTELGESIAELIEGIDWLELGTTLLECLWNAVVAVSSTLFTTFSHLFGDIAANIVLALCDLVDYLGENDLGDIGSNILDGILQGISDAITNIGTWIEDNIFTPFMDGVKSAFGIASPSKKMAEVGGYLVEGLEQGVEDEDPASYFEDVWADISGVFDGVDSWFSDTFSSAFTSAEDAWSGSKTTFTTVKDNVVSGFSTLKDNVSTKFSTAMTGAESAWSGAKTAFTTVSGNVVDGFSALSANLKQSFGTAFSSAKNAWGNAKSVFTTVSGNVVSGFKSLSSDIKGKFKAAITTVKGLDWKGTGTNVVSGILNGMYNWGSKLKSWANSLLSKAQSALGIASPSTLFRDEVGLFLGLGVAEGLEDSTGSVMDTVQSLAANVAEGLNGIDTGVSLSAATVGLDSTLDSFAETVTEGFSALIIDLRGLLEQAAELAPDLSGVTISDVTSQAETLRGAQSYTSVSGADESWMDSLADRVAQRVSAQSGSTGGGNQNITVQCVLDGKIVAQNTVTYINGEARRTGVNPLAAYL